MDAAGFSMTVRDKLKALRIKAKMSIRAVSAALGLGETSYRYYESRDFKGSYIPMELARQLVELWGPRGVDSGEILALAGNVVEVPQHGAGLRSPEAVPYLVADGSAEAGLIAMLAPTAKRADLWVMHSRALDLAGILPGDMMVVDIGDAHARKGDIVCAQVHSRTSDEAETLFRIYEKPYLVALSSERRYAKPLQVDDNDVTIMGRVLASFRQLQRE